jgi:hypothetical protein
MFCHNQPLPIPHSRKPNHYVLKLDYTRARNLFAGCDEVNGSQVTTSVTL